MINKGSINKIVGRTTINHEHSRVIMYSAREFDQGFGFVMSELVDLVSMSGWVWCRWAQCGWLMIRDGGAVQGWWCQHKHHPPLPAIQHSGCLVAWAGCVVVSERLYSYAGLGLWKWCSLRTVVERRPQGAPALPSLGHGTR